MVLESVGLIVTLMFALVVMARIGYLTATGLTKAVQVAMWVVFGYFVLNIVGNLASASALEKALFTPASIILAFLALRLALGNRDE